MALAKNFFSPQEQALLVEAIRKAESHTSGEIRLHLENFCWGSGMHAAQRIFTRLGMHQTKERNGVLIYIATMSHKLAVIGDEGIHQKLGAAFWQELVDNMIAKFKANKKAEALAEVIGECGQQLGKFFPRQHDDRDELSNEISY